MRIWTVGHSTRALDEFLTILCAHDIHVIADVRQFPGSRRYPQYNKEQLAQSLANAGTNYVHFPELGGRRKPKADSRNMAWRNEAFRGYADYMETSEFRQGAERLIGMASQNTAIMCAEAVWWRCHRALISDYLKARGFEVIHIMNERRTKLHPFTKAARMVAGVLSYGSDDELL
ncbi:MAG: hypothetical protein DLM52_01620 [Chthoniobacterales bacterium]|nr:MAG: hypothetical protein DLM52_01620 [Chthoniobacterales bacterium]